MSLLSVCGARVLVPYEGGRECGLVAECSLNDCSKVLSYLVLSFTVSCSVKLMLRMLGFRGQVSVTSGTPSPSPSASFTWQVTNLVSSAQPTEFVQVSRSKNDYILVV